MKIWIVEILDLIIGCATMIILVKSLHMDSMVAATISAIISVRINYVTNVKSVYASK